ncbi:MAG: guanine deaminase [Gammaproteobacteria bacterium]
MTPKTAHRATLAHFIADPAVCGERACAYYEDGLLVVGTRGEVIEAGAAKALLPKYAAVPVVRHKDAILLPGFVDTHIHFPQVDVIASYGADLLDWLTKYTFPAEAAFARPDIAEKAAKFFIKQLIANGTTSALVFATSHKHSADALFAEARKRKMRLAAGKVLMNRNAPATLLDTISKGKQDTRQLIRKWHNNGRLHYAITPRFAPTSTPAQLKAAGALLQEFPDVLLHTHLSENRRELQWVRSLFPDAADYLAVYEKHGLVCDRSIFAHGIHLSGGEWRRLARAGSALAHCPLSNMFLGSGLFDIAKARRHKIRTGLGTDVGGGNSFSMFRVMEEAYKTARLRGSDFPPLSMWHAATLGGAQALRMDSHIGNFTPGKDADFITIDLSSPPLLSRRWHQTQTPPEKLFTLTMLATPPQIKATYIMGKKQQ